MIPYPYTHVRTSAHTRTHRLSHTASRDNEVQSAVSLTCTRTCIWATPVSFSQSPALKLGYSYRVVQSRTTRAELKSLPFPVDLEEATGVPVILVNQLPVDQITSYQKVGFSWSGGPARPTKCRFGRTVFPRAVSCRASR